MPSKRDLFCFGGIFFLLLCGIWREAYQTSGWFGRIGLFFIHIVLTAVLTLAMFWGG